MAAIDDLKTAIAAEDQLVDQAVAFIKGTPDVIAAAVAAAKAGDDATLQQIQQDVQAHADALTGALPASTVTADTPAVQIPQ